MFKRQEAKMESISGQDADDVEILSLNYNSDDESQKVNNSHFTDYNNISIENNFERGVKNAEVINLDDCSSNSNSFSTKKLNENGNSNNTYSDITPNLRLVTFSDDSSSFFFFLIE